MKTILSHSAKDVDVFAIYTLQTWDDKKMKQDIFNYKLLYEYQDKDLGLIPDDRIIHVKYEDFIQQPVEHMEKIYSHLKLKGWDQYKDDIFAYAESQKRDYKPNVHDVDDDTIRRVNAHWSAYMEKYGYEKLEPKGPE